MAEDTRQRIIEAALEALRTQGHGGASAREIARIGGFNAGLIYHYFPNLDELYLSALEHSSNERLERYEQAAAEVETAGELIALLQRIYAEDQASGHIRVVSELVAASVSRPEMGPRVIELMEPWVELAQSSLKRAMDGSPLDKLISSRELALAGVTFYLGANLMSQLVPDRPEVDNLLDAAQRGVSSFGL